MIDFIGWYVSYFQMLWDIWPRLQYFMRYFNSALCCYPIVQMSRRSIVLLSHFLFDPLSCFLLSSCLVFLLSRSPVVLLSYGSVVLLSYCPVVWLSVGLFDLMPWYRYLTKKSVTDRKTISRDASASESNQALGFNWCNMWYGLTKVTSSTPILLERGSKKFLLSKFLDLYRLSR